MANRELPTGRRIAPSILAADYARLDQVDVITDATAGDPNGSCERVVRADPKPREDGTENGTENPAQDSAQS